MSNSKQTQEENNDGELLKEQKCTEGLTQSQLIFANKQIIFFRELGVAVPYNLIRDTALKQ